MGKINALRAEIGMDATTCEDPANRDNFNADEHNFNAVMFELVPLSLCTNTLGSFVLRGDDNGCLMSIRSKFLVLDCKLTMILQEMAR